MTVSLLAMIGALVAVPPDGQAQPAWELNSLVAEVEKFYADKQDFSARFEQTLVRTHLPDRPVKKKGKLYFKKPGMMRWDYSQPEQVHYVTDGKVLWNYIPESKLAYKMEVRDWELFYALKFLYGEGALRKDFDVSHGGIEDGKRVIVVKPKTSEQNFRELRLLVAPDSPTISGTVLVDPAGNKSTITFVAVSYLSLPEEGFKFTPPEDIQVEDLSSPPPNP